MKEKKPSSMDENDRQQQKARCPLCRKVIEGVPKQSLAVSKLSTSANNTVVTLTFDKKECALVFERLRRFYGDDFFSELNQQQIQKSTRPR